MCRQVSYLLYKEIKYIPPIREETSLLNKIVNKRDEQYKTEMGQKKKILEHSFFKATHKPLLTLFNKVTTKLTSLIEK